MKDKSTCWLKMSANGLPQPTQEEIILDIKDEGICLLYFVAAPEGGKYTQEVFFYTWKSNKFIFLSETLLMISGIPEEAIDKIPLVITQTGRNCRVVKRSEFTVVVKLSDESVRAVKQALRRNRG